MALNCLFMRQHAAVPAGDDVDKIVEICKRLLILQQELDRNVFESVRSAQTRNNCAHIRSTNELEPGLTDSTDITRERSFEGAAQLYRGDCVNQETCGHRHLEFGTKSGEKL